MDRVFKPLRCQLPVNGKPCGRYLADVEAGTPVTLRFTCPIKHRHDHGHNRIEFHQDEYGFVSYRALSVESEKDKVYIDDGVRISR